MNNIQTEYKLVKGISNRWSPRAYSEKNIEQEKLDSIFLAASKAPSSMNEQPWRFILGKKGDDNYSKLLDSLAEGNKSWAYSAPVLIGIVSKVRFEYKERPNRHALYDTGQAVANMMVQATELDLYGHQMGGFDRDKLNDHFNISDTFDPVVVLSLGYIGNPDILPDNLKEREVAESKRKSVSELFLN